MNCIARDGMITIRATITRRNLIRAAGVSGGLGVLQAGRSAAIASIRETLTAHRDGVSVRLRGATWLVSSATT
jgi:hypothetical protein